ncbi:MAG: HTH-type transcriptional repressor FabR [Jiangellaceae bacterium]
MSTERSRDIRHGRHSPSSRRESKELTRKALVRAALKLLSRNSFDSISLREVTREAGISPTAFYRHFDDMEELGLVLVEESFGSLREMLRTARADPSVYEDAIRRSVAAVVQHVRDNAGHMRFIARERYGGVRRLRRAISRELQLFTDELSIDLAAFPGIGKWPADDRRMFANLVVETMVSISAQLLDASPDEEEGVADRAVHQLRLISLGVPLWRPEHQS